jgi:cytochrome c-type biogenesis protein CcmH/NrfG
MTENSRTPGIVRDARTQRRGLDVCWTALLLVAGTALPARANAVDIRAQAAVSTKRPYLGDSVVLQVSVEQSVERQPEIDTADLESLGARPVGQPSFGHSRTIVNGVSSEKFTFQFQFQFTASKVGALAIPAITVRQGQSTAKTTPFEIQVIGPEPQDSARVELEASERSAYPGQSVTFTVSVLLRRLTYQGELLDADPFSPREPPQVKMSWLEGTEVLKPALTLGQPPRFAQGSLEQRAREEGPSFLINDLFVRQTISLFEPRAMQTPVRFDRVTVERDGPNGDKESYYRYSVPLEFRAAHTGSIGPLTVQFRGSIYSGVRRGVRGFEADSREVFAVSDPLTVHVLAVPKAGQPDTFSGGVGSFKIAATAQPTKVHVGDPITLSVRVTGTGNLEEIGPPNLAVQEKWGNDFKIYEDAAPGRFEDKTKVFSISVRPKNAQVTELPSIRLSYFNPKLKKYEDTYSDRIPLEVAETSRLDTSTLVDASAAGATPRELEEQSGGLAANHTDMDALVPQQAYEISMPVAALATVAPALAWCLVYIGHRRTVRLRDNPAWRRAHGAHGRAAQRLQSIASATDCDVPDQVARAVGAYLADRLNLSTGELTPTEALHHAKSLGAPEPLAHQLSELLQHCDQARFAQRGDGRATAALISEARRLLDQMQQATALGRRRPQAAAVSVARLLLIGVAIATATGHSNVANAQEPVDRVAVLSQANASFERGARAKDPGTASESFREAIAGYERLTAAGVQNGKLYYNLANAYFRVGDVPHAILNYRLAESLLPRDEQIASNLAFARTHVADRIETSESRRLLRQLLFAYYSLSVRERIQFAVASYVIAWLLLGLRIWLPRRWLTVTGLAALGVSLAVATSALVESRNDAQHPIGVLVAPDVVVRKGDGDTYEPQFNRTLGAGVEFRVRNNRDNWIEIEFDDGKSGWIRAEQAAVGEPTRRS